MNCVRCGKPTGMFCYDCDIQYQSKQFSEDVWLAKVWLRIDKCSIFLEWDSDNGGIASYTKVELDEHDGHVTHTHLALSIPCVDPKQALRLGFWNRIKNLRVFL